MSWKKTKIGKFLFEREGRFKPDDKSLLNLDRLEKIDFSGNFHIGQKASRTDMILIKRGDFVISGINVSKGAIGIYRKDHDITATIHYSSYTFDESKIDINYFEHFLQSAEFLRLLEDKVKGGIKTEIKAKHLLNLEISLPSLDQQKQIAEKLKHSEERQKLLQQEIENQKTNLKNLRKQILQDAVEGKLTKEWREKNPDIEPASELLKRIRQEKENLIAEKKIKKEKPLPSIIESEAASWLPFGWSYERLGNFCLNMDDKRIPISKSLRIGINKIYDYYGASGVIDKIDGFTHEGDHLLIGEYGANLVSRSTPIAFVASGKFWVNNHAHVLRFFNPESLLYVKNFINAISLDKYITGGFQPKLNQFNLNRILLFIPPLNEQRVIVNKLKELMQKLDEAEKQIEKSLETSKLLTKAILAEAFKGEVAEFS